jgi:hypothetical protein
VNLVEPAGQGVSASAPSVMLSPKARKLVAASLGACVGL